MATSLEQSLGSPNNVIRLIYSLLGDEKSRDMFPRNVLLESINRGLAYCAARGIRGWYWHVSATAFTEGVHSGSLTLPAMTEGGASYPRDIAAVRRTADLVMLAQVSPARLESMRQNNSAARGKPEFYAVFSAAETNSITASFLKLNFWVFPAPGAGDSPPVYLDVLASSYPLARLGDTGDAATIWLREPVQRGIALRIAAEMLMRSTPEMLAELKLSRDVIPGWLADAELLIADEARWIYQTALQSDFVLMEN